jgi:glycosyltransferase involved in cell wall biosynthesis
MNLCLYTATFLPIIGGAELILHELASFLAAQGHGVTVLAPYVRRADNRVEAPYRLQRYQRPSSKRFGVRQVLLHLMYAHWRQPFDVLHCHGAYPPAYVGATFGRIFKRPLVVRPHGADILPGEYIRAHPRLAQRLRRALAAAHLVIAQSEFLQREIKALGVPDAKIRLIPNGVRVAQFQEKLQPPPWPYPYILAVGSFSRKKGFDVLLRAFADLVKQEHAVHLVVAGAGKDLPVYERLIAQLAIQERVHLVGIVRGSQKVQLYQHCLFFVCPSRREPFAAVNLEALAAGKPIVATAVGGNVEVVIEGGNGLLVPPEDPQALAARMLMLLQDPALRAMMGQESAHLAQRYDYQVTLPRYTAVFEEAIAGYGAELR